MPSGDQLGDHSHPEYVVSGLMVPPAMSPADESPPRPNKTHASTNAAAPGTTYPSSRRCVEAADGSGASSTGATGVSVTSASANALALANRSAGTLASALFTAASMLAGTVSRTVLSLTGLSPITFAMTACMFDPMNGGSPANISYSTLPSA